MTRDIQRLLDGQQKGVWPPQKIQALDKCLGELSRLFVDMASNTNVSSSTSKISSISSDSSVADVLKDQTALSSLGAVISYSNEPQGANSFYLLETNFCYYQYRK